MEKFTPDEEVIHDQLVERLAPLDIPKAIRVLLEIKEVMDKAGITFFLRQGTCLGAVRDKAFIPWDDDIDIGSVIGLHGLSEEKIEPVVHTLRESGFITKIEHADDFVWVPIVKPPVLVDWMCYRVMGDVLFMYPASRIPVQLFVELKKMDFIGSEFYVPNPPEEYLEVKYGPEWHVPKLAGDYEKDIINLISEGAAYSRVRRLKQVITQRLLPWRAAAVMVLDERDQPMNDARISVVGLGTFRANKQGIVKLHVPSDFWYALVIKFSGHERTLFVEKVKPAGKYIYRPKEEHLQAISAL
ncbi:LicD family protein [Chloroflexota bacterium]